MKKYKFIKCKLCEIKHINPNNENVVEINRKLLQSFLF